MRRVVIVGAGPAGMRCAERLAGRGMAVTLIGAEAGLPYNRVALSKLLAGEMTAPDLITHDGEALTEAGIASVLLRGTGGLRVLARAGALSAELPVAGR